MHKRLFLTLILALCALMMGISAIASPSAQTLDPQSGVFALAQYIPAEVNLYISVRADDAYIAALDGYLGKFGSAYAEVLTLLKSPIGVEMPLTVAGITKGSMVGNLTYPDFFNIIGDQFMVGNIVNSTSGYIAFSLTDSEAFVALLVDTGHTESDPQGEYRVFSVDFPSGYTWYVSETYAFARSGVDGVQTPNFPTGDYAKLSDSPTFQAALTSLPDYSPDFFVYVDGAVISDDPSLFSTFSTLGMTPESLTVSGGALADGTLALDVVVRPASAPNSPITQPVISAEFARNAPLSADAVIHGSNLANVLTDLRERIPDYVTIVEQIKGATQFDLQALQAALGGEFILFASYDTNTLAGIATSQVGSSSALLNTVQFGAAIQMTDEAAAIEQASALSDLLTYFSPVIPAMIHNVEQIGDVSATVFTIPTPVGTNEIWTLQLMIAAKGDVLFIGTAASIREVLNGQSGYTDIAGYSSVTANALPNASSIGYLGSDGSLLLAAFPALAIVNSIPVGSASASVSMEFDSTGAFITPEATVELSLTQAADLTLTPQVTQEPSPTPVPSPTPDFPVVIPQVIERIARLLPGASFSTSYDADGIHRLRLTITTGQ